MKLSDLKSSDIEDVLPLKREAPIRVPERGPSRAALRLSDLSASDVEESEGAGGGILQTTQDFLAGVREGFPLSGLIEKAAAVPVAALDSLTTDKSFEQAYDAVRAEQDAGDAARAARSPVANTSGNVAGAFLAPNPTGSALTRIPANAALAAVDAATRQDSLEDAAEAGLEAGGTSAAVETAISAVSPALGKLAKKYGQGKEKAADAIEDFAAERAVKATGAKTKEFKDLNRKGQMASYGKELLKQGIVAAGDKAEDVLRKASLLRKSASQKIGGYLGQFDDLLKANPDLGFHPQRLADRIDAEIIAPLRDKAPWRGVVKDLENELAELRKLGDKPLSFEEANDLKRAYDEFLDFTKEQTPLKEKMKQLRGILNAEIENSADRIADAAGISSNKDWKDAKKLFGIAAKAEDSAREEIARQSANRFISPTDHFVGGAAAMADVAGGGGMFSLGRAAAGALTNKLLRERGTSTAAVGLNNLAQRVRTSPESFGRFAGALQAAAQRGNKSLAATHYLLQQREPEYRQTLKGDDDQ